MIKLNSSVYDTLSDGLDLFDLQWTVNICLKYSKWQEKSTL